ncbi:MAG: prolipoprotein diacylglyceryl transferase [Candidatus Woesearchaeota archaeon]
MIPYKIFPPFELGPLHINMYGIMFALGILVASLLAIREAKKRGIKKEVIEDLVLYLLIGIIVGARLFDVFFYWPADMPLTFWDIFAVWNGGMAFFGGFIGALIAGFIYTRKHKLNFWKFADIFTLPLIVGHILGRLGDYFTGGHPGKVTNLPWAIYLDGALRHPVVVYEIIGLIIIGIIIYNLRKLHKFDGFLFLVYVQLYSVQRIILDFFRIESTDPRYLGLTPTQYVGIVLFIIAGYFIVIKYKKREVKK